MHTYPVQAHTGIPPRPTPPAPCHTHFRHQNTTSDKFGTKVHLGGAGWGARWGPNVCQVHCSPSCDHRQSPRKLLFPGIGFLCSHDMLSHKFGCLSPSTCAKWPNGQLARRQSTRHLLHGHHLCGGLKAHRLMLQLLCWPCSAWLKAQHVACMCRVALCPWRQT